MSFFGGSFLIARPTLRDPNFHQTVILLIHHDAESAFGLVVNRPVPAKGLPYPTYVGGPCEAQGLFLLHGNPKWAAHASPDKPANEVAPGIFLGDAGLAPILNELPKDDLKRVRMYAGYSGWGAGQLEREMAEGAWATAPADGKTLFGTRAEDLWSHLRPPFLPQPSMN